MSMIFILAQCIGLVGVLCFIISFQVKSNRGLFLAQTFGCIAFCVQFLLVDAYTSSMVYNHLHKDMYYKKIGGFGHEIFLLCISPAWLIYDISVGAYAGALNESVILCSIAVSIFRFGWSAMGDPDSDFQK